MAVNQSSSAERGSGGTYPERRRSRGHAVCTAAAETAVSTTEQGAQHSLVQQIMSQVARVCPRTDSVTGRCWDAHAISEVMHLNLCLGRSCCPLLKALARHFILAVSGSAKRHVFPPVSKAPSTEKRDHPGHHRPTRQARGFGSPRPSWRSSGIGICHQRLRPGAHADSLRRAPNPGALSLRPKTPR